MRSTMISSLVGAAVLAVGCTPTYSMRADYGVDRERYAHDPEQVVIMEQGGQSVLVNGDAEVIDRPWEVVGTFNGVLYPDHHTARELGCDAYYQATTQGDGYIRYEEGTVDGIEINMGDQLCIQYLDEEAAAEREETEGSYAWTQFQRPPRGSGNVLTMRVPMPFSEAFPEFSFEHYFRHFPLGYELHFGPGKPGDDGVKFFGVGAGLLVSILPLRIPFLGDFQLSGALRAAYMFASEDVTNAGGGPIVELQPGVYLDWLFLRFMHAGFALYYHLGIGDVPEEHEDTMGLEPSLRIGFLF